MEPKELLQHYFGHKEFRPGQEPLIQSILAGRDVLGVMPTSAGKSICYQIPAMALPGMTLVISPLISLMADQVASLNQAGIAAAYLNSSLDAEEYREILRKSRQGAYKLLYVAPERLFTPGFLAMVQQATISFVAVDEAHCVSQWGQDFRPSYLKISEFLQQLPTRPVLGAFTATATQQVKADIISLLQLQNPLTLTTGFDRPNLYFGVVHTKQKDAWILDYLRKNRGKSGIVYCSTRKNVEALCVQLQSSGFSATRYHAGLSDQERKKNQEDFVYDRAQIMVATNAFGMGIDKSNVSFVLHYNMPKNLESYYQEAGRAGRDGEPASCILLFSPGDVQTAKFLILNSSDNQELSVSDKAILQERDLERLEKMERYCKTTDCLRQTILAYFGQEILPCRNCSTCLGTYQAADITVEAQKILSGVARVCRLYPSGLGKALIVQMLRGSRGKRILELNLDGLPTYGILKGLSQELLTQYIDRLIELEYLAVTPTEFPVLLVTAKARRVLFEGEKVEILLPVKSSSTSKVETEVPDDLLLTNLKARRMQLAQKEGVPAYIIFSNATLTDMALKRPMSMDALLEVSGVGKVKAQRYGNSFLDVIRTSLRANL